MRGVERADDRRVISGIVHVLRSGCRWCDCPPEYGGPPTTIYNRFVRWAGRVFWENLFGELAGIGRATGTLLIDSTHIKAHRPAAGGNEGEQKQVEAAAARRACNTKIHVPADAKGRLIAIPLTGGEAHDYPVADRLIRRVKPSKHLLGDKAYDSAELRCELDERGSKPVIPNKSNRKQPSASTTASTSCVTSRVRSTGSRTSGALPPAMTSSHATTWPLFVWLPRSYGGFNESGP